MNIQSLTVFKDYEIMPVSLMVPEENILAMGGFQILPIFDGFFNGGCGRMLVIFKRDIQII
jgi:hypothetical protein